MSDSIFQCPLCSVRFVERSPVAAIRRAQAEAAVIWDVPATADACGTCYSLVVIWATEHRPDLLTGDLPPRTRVGSVLARALAG